MWEPHRIITVLPLSKSHCSSQKVLKEAVVVLIIFAATVYGLFLFLHTSDLDANICQKKAELCLHKRSSRAKRAGDNKLQVMFPSSLDTSSQALKEEVIGVEGEVVPVFFHVYSVGQTLPCLMRDLLFQGFVDPKFEWIGPNGLISKESQRFVITDNGNLVFDTIYVVDSGNYTCNLMYRLDLKQVTRLVRYTVYVYHNPNKSVRLEADFYATKCNNNEITKFEKHLQKQLEDAVQDLQCEVHHWNSACHGIKPSPMSHIFNFQFIVFPFALGWADDCNDPQCDQQSEERVKKEKHDTEPNVKLKDLNQRNGFEEEINWNLKNSDLVGKNTRDREKDVAMERLEHKDLGDIICHNEAYTRIRSFIEDYPFKRKLQNIDYIANSLNGVKVDHCKPGFGKNVITSNQCEGCCVACPPGHFSARQDTICTPCAFGSFNRHYGKTECTNCPHNEATNRSGATSQQECHWIIYQWMLPVTSTIGTCIFLITIWIICRKYCKTPMKGKYVQVKEEDVKEEMKTLANVIKDVDLLEQKSKLRPSEFIVRHSPKHGVEFSDDQCIGLLSDTDSETCRTFDTLKSDETTCPKSSMEECISPCTSDDSCFTSRSSTPQNLEAIFRHGR